MSTLFMIILSLVIAGMAVVLIYVWDESRDCKKESWKLKETKEELIRRNQFLHSELKETRKDLAESNKKNKDLYRTNQRLDNTVGRCNEIISEERQNYKALEKGMDEMQDSYEQQYLTYLETIGAQANAIKSFQEELEDHRANCLPTVDGEIEKHAVARAEQNLRLLDE